VTNTTNRTTKQKTHLTPAGLLMEGDSTSLRFLFPSLGIDECKSDCVPTRTCDHSHAPSTACPHSPNPYVNTRDYAQV